MKSWYFIVKRPNLLGHPVLSELLSTYSRAAAAPTSAQTGLIQLHQKWVHRTDFRPKYVL